MRAALTLAVVLLTGTAHAADPPPQQVDSLTSVTELLAKTDKSAADKLDALFYVTNGRFVSGREHRLVKRKLGDRPTARELITLVAELDPPAYIGVGLWPSRRGDYGLLPRPQWFVAEGSEDRVLVPNPLFLPPMPWIPPGSTTPMPRTGFGVVATTKP